MARTVYVTGVEPGSGRATVALGVAELLSRRVRRLGAFRPLVRTDPDPILELLRTRYHLSAVGFGATYAEARELIAAGRVNDLVERIVDAFRIVDEQADAAVVIGTDFGRDGGDTRDGNGLADELALNARLAIEMHATVLPVVDAHGRDGASVAASIRSAFHALIDLRTTQVAVIANRVDDATDGPALATADDLRGVPVFAVPDVAAVSAPTVAEVCDALHATRLLGGAEAYTRDVLSVVVGGATVPTFLDHLRDGALVIAPGDRADLVVAAYSVHVAGQVTLAGIMLTLGIEPDKRVLALVERLGGNLPVCVVQSDTFETVARVAAVEGRLSVDNSRKVEAALGAFESSVDTAQLARRLDIARSARVTPLMFEYELISRARSVRRHVVLPEGTEERILRATEILLRRGVCDVTLLGPVNDVRRRIRELALTLDGAAVIDPATSPWRDEFASAYATIRAAKGITVDAARDRLADPNYFGTMMVHRGYADAMVSGAAHPTADTIRPAFEIIKTVPGLSAASSVFFMCLADEVLVYGDCAINPDPDPRQLADIAISSAATAAAFGIEPRVAMLSYSTGTSGHGIDVEKVAAATDLVRQRHPDLLVDGPIQYDAAVDPTVAAAKAPDSPLAGHATVLIFPDLNTGNNTYKAVQRSAGAVAIGPVLQGLRRPVNDLSRGATVADIVNTVAITAIQATIS
ncbi:MAG TPA: phosphate acetyltransferase [Micromonosporaceae bacterium]|nr:phosphate acetyltransferase [Micromonosporaceae bacterium]